ncbi:MAG: hypothetical protein MRY63_03295 [Neomegalonema sp.]|nr:hypothetical protein [Neomegalonema sp.]
MRAGWNGLPKRLRWGAALGLALLLSGCGVGRWFASDDPAPASVAEPNRPLQYRIDSAQSRADLAEALAQYALKCWIRRDPTYRIAGPSDEGRLHRLALVRLPLDEDGKPKGPAITALVLKIAQLAPPQYQIDASGPLANPAYAAKIKSGISAAAVGSLACS